MDPTGNYLVPTVIEDSGRGERAFDLYSRMMRDRVIFLNSQVDDASANIIIAQLLFLESEDMDKPVNLYINSPGGSITAGMAIYDTMQYIASPVHTTCVGLAASMGAFLLAGGHPGERRALPHSEIMIHQPMGGAQGQATDMEIAMNRMRRLKERLNQLLAENTGQDLAKVTEDCERDNWLTAEEAHAYGLIDDVILSTRQEKAERVAEAEED